VFVVARCIIEQLRGKCFTFHVKCFVQNVVMLVEMCQKRETLFVALNSELSLPHSVETEVSVKESVNAVRD
jgi:hypothetical protein